MRWLSYVPQTLLLLGSKLTTAGYRDTPQGGREILLTEPGVAASTGAANKMLAAFPVALHLASTYKIARCPLVRRHEHGWCSKT